MSWEDDIAICRRMLRGGSKTFFAASKVLPRAVGDPAIALYAFCREADDAIDGPGRKVDAVEMLHERLERIYEGRPDDSPVDRALAGAVAAFAIPRALPEALLEGLAWDAQGRRYDTLSDVLAYAVRVAGTVGVMMSLLMHRRDAETVGRACDLGIAMQLTNIARDVGEDARNGRLYLPRQWLRETGLDVETWRAAPFFDDRIARVTARLLAVADVFYARAAAGIADLPWNCRPGIHAARLIYAEIGREVARAEFDSLSRRAVVSMPRKLRLLGKAALVSFAQPQPSLAPARPEARVLIDAVIAADAHRPHALAPPRRTMHDRALWVIDLFERLERRDQLSRSARTS
ncbi:phytoene synthase [Bradyrhizobium sp. ORS 278]|uniref:phytoene/squalene synthase family protein n=1 Tax=Bradyrhizobium sp. (strain ORS 278) TaxID=114615 RepID=UPI00002366C9|nr:phytoene/squalene synthase family protein [Bradyrhizobium sp. ORS 278]AAR98492.1 phytoene synthase [Bradyrhizobium sp. ORS 278]CAL75490.1 phytoene synthase [Bradyrhizobium sp. ORS 278]